MILDLISEEWERKEEEKQVRETDEENRKNQNENKWSKWKINELGWLDLVHIPKQSSLSMSFCCRPSYFLQLPSQIH